MAFQNTDFGLNHADSLTWRHEFCNRMSGYVIRSENPRRLLDEKRWLPNEKGHESAPAAPAQRPAAVRSDVQEFRVEAWDLGSRYILARQLISAVSATCRMKLNHSNTKDTCLVERNDVCLRPRPRHLRLGATFTRIGTSAVLF
jgi:hypothetical protein